ncbi:MAG: Sulfate transport system permease protein CysW [Candidatus Heimdallarchaeota archaeon LC_3]|nr:MAG: Sulfate transport system permease protein CysW [Candidatus Heimdallarchaeota archaeon LC_3]
MGNNLKANFLSFRSSRKFTNIWYFLVLIIFFLFIIFPTTYVLIYVFTRIEEIINFFNLYPSSPDIIFRALLMSFSVSIFVTIIDLVFGLVLAWILANKSFRGKELVNTLIESPLAIPTAGLGFSVALFWAKTQGIDIIPFGALQIVDDVWLLIVLFHFTTTFPYVVRSLTEILQEIDKSYEIAALTSGASKLTAARTITLPMFRSGFSTAAILAMAKSLSDTGGVVTLLTTFKGSRLDESDQIQGTALIDIWKGVTKTTASAIERAQYEAALALVSFLMIIIALILLFFIKFSIRNINSPTKKVYPKIEARLSRGIYVHFRNSISTGFIVLFVFIPSFFIISYLVDIKIPANFDWNPFFGSIAISFFVAFVAILFNIILGIPIAIFITRKKSVLSPLIDAIIDIPYLVPSAAVGISVFLFWKSSISPLTITCLFGYCIAIPDIILVIFAHMAMTFPFIARNVVGGLQEFPESIEETARSLGATPLQVFYQITLPSIKGSVLAGAVMGFTRSVGETGATLAVSSLETAPVYIVNQIKNDQNYSVAAMATLLLMIIGYIFIFTTKAIINSGQLRKDFKILRRKLRL